MWLEKCSFLLCVLVIQETVRGQMTTNSGAVANPGRGREDAPGIRFSNAVYRAYPVFLGEFAVLDCLTRFNASDRGTYQLDVYLNNKRILNVQENDTILPATISPYIWLGKFADFSYRIIAVSQKDLGLYNLGFTSRNTNFACHYNVTYRKLVYPPLSELKDRSYPFIHRNVIFMPKGVKAQLFLPCSYINVDNVTDFQLVDPAGVTMTKHVNQLNWEQVTKYNGKEKTVTIFKQTELAALGFQKGPTLPESTFAVAFGGWVSSTEIAWQCFATDNRSYTLDVYKVINDYPPFYIEEKGHEGFLLKVKKGEPAHISCAYVFKNGNQSQNFSYVLYRNKYPFPYETRNFTLEIRFPFANTIVAKFKISEAEVYHSGVYMCQINSGTKKLTSARYTLFVANNFYTSASDPFKTYEAWRRKNPSASNEEISAQFPYVPAPTGVPATNPPVPNEGAGPQGSKIKVFQGEPRISGWTLRGTCHIQYYPKPGATADWSLDGKTIPKSFIDNIEGSTQPDGGLFKLHSLLTYNLPANYEGGTLTCRMCHPLYLPQCEAVSKAVRPVVSLSVKIESVVLLPNGNSFLSCAASGAPLTGTLSWTVNGGAVAEFNHTAKPEPEIGKYTLVSTVVAVKKPGDSSRTSDRYECRLTLQGAPVESAPFDFVNVNRAVSAQPVMLWIALAVVIPLMLIALAVGIWWCVSRRRREKGNKKGKGGRYQAIPEDDEAGEFDYEVRQRRRPG